MKFSNMLGYKIIFQKSILFLYMRNKHKAKEVMDIPQFTISRNKSNQMVKTLYNEHFKPLKKDIEKKQHKLERYPMLTN